MNSLQEGFGDKDIRNKDVTMDCTICKAAIRQAVIKEIKEELEDEMHYAGVTAHIRWIPCKVYLNYWKGKGV